MTQRPEQEPSTGWRNWLNRVTGRALRSLPELAAARLESEARKLGPATIPAIFWRDLRPLDPTFNEELLEISGHAEMALRNRFTFFNRAQNFGQAIGWESSLSGAWRTELHSFDFALDLAVMFRVSGEERYARHLRYFIADWIASNPPLESTGWEPVPLARRIRNWTLAFDLARPVWEADAEFARVASRSMALQCAALEQELQSQEEPAAGPDVAVAMLLFAKLFGSSTGNANRALDVLRAAVDRDLCAAGSRQATPAARVGLARAILEFILFETGFDGETADWLKTTLERALRAVEEILLADGTLPLFGAKAPPNSEKVDELFATSAAVLGAAWAKAAGQNFGVFPLLLLGPPGRERFQHLAPADWSPANVSISPAGLYRLAGPPQSSLAITAAPNATSGHEDHLSYELMLRGMRVVVDSGACAPAGEGDEDYFASPGAHNVLLIDGRLAGLAPSSKTEMGAAELNSTADFTRLRITAAAPNCSRRDRAWFCLPDGAWLVADRISSAQPHRLLSLIHFFPTFGIALQNGFALASSHSLALIVIPFGTSRPSLNTGRGEDASLRGWYSPEYGIRYEAAVLACEWNSQPGDWTGGYLISRPENTRTAPATIRVEGDALWVDSAGGVRRLPLGDIKSETSG